MHRDFKLENIFVHNGQPKIGDFGFAKRIKEHPDEVQKQTILGTPLTMAPEVFMKQPYNNQADIYSLGVVYYQMLFGVYPYQA